MPDTLVTRDVAAIQVGTRHRKHLGDLQPLKDSMATLGLLHPVVITPDDHLVAGARRLAAARLLGWTEIPVRVIDLPSLLQAEHDENVLRAPFLPTEAVAIGRALEEEIAQANAVKMREAGKVGGKTAGRGRIKPPDSPVTNNHTPIHAATTRAQVGKAVGMGGTTYSKAKSVVRAAEESPERYGDLVVQMDVTGNVDRAFQTMQRRQDTDALPGKSPSPRADKEPAEIWHTSLHTLYAMMKSVRDGPGGLAPIIHGWKADYRIKSAAELRRICGILQEWICALEEPDHDRD